MSNEPLGIYQELRERAERYANRGEALRRRILNAGPADNGACAQLANPFDVTAALRMKNAGTPFYRRMRRYPRQRAIWPEADLGLSILQVVQAVALESGLSADDMVGPSHRKKFSWPRHVAMWAIDRYCPDYSLPEIAYVFHRDHTSVMYAIDATNVRLMNHCSDTSALVANVRQRLHRIATGGD